MEGLLRQALTRAEEVARELADPATARDAGRLQALGREHARLAPIARLAERRDRLADDLRQAEELVRDGADPELAALAQLDIARIPAELAQVNAELDELLLPRDPLEDRDAILELRAGTGGDEAA
ncbi:MAG TPA: PCRF domain-containing protein, partial [Gemmatimonadales bacterium]